LSNVPNTALGKAAVSASIPSFGVQSTILTYERSAPIYHDTDSADHFYHVQSGAARNYALLDDGRRRIVDFLLPGDFFGFDGRHHHSFGVEAIVRGTRVTRYSRRALETAANRDPHIASELREITLDAMSRSQARLLILGRVTAIEKVAAFLIEMKERSSDGDPQVVTLLMSRYDIADYLAISVETVSRALTELSRCGAIEFAGKHCVRLQHRGSLASGLH
jgi:CRP-like cAMP-binding protein